MIRGKKLRPLAVVGDKPVELDGYGVDRAADQVAAELQGAGQLLRHLHSEGRAAGSDRDGREGLGRADREFGGAEAICDEPRRAVRAVRGRRSAEGGRARPCRRTRGGRRQRQGEGRRRTRWVSAPVPVERCTGAASIRASRLAHRRLPRGDPRSAARPADRSRLAASVVVIVVLSWQMDRMTQQGATLLHGARAVAGHRRARCSPCWAACWCCGRSARARSAAAGTPPRPTTPCYAPRSRFALAAAHVLRLRAAARRPRTAVLARHRAVRLGVRVRLPARAPQGRREARLDARRSPSRSRAARSPPSS